MLRAARAAPGGVTEEEAAALATPEERRPARGTPAARRLGARLERPASQVSAKELEERRRLCLAAYGLTEEDCWELGQWARERRRKRALECGVEEDFAALFSAARDGAGVAGEAGDSEEE